MRGWSHDLALGASCSHLHLRPGLSDGRSRMIEYIVSMGIIICLVLLAFGIGYWAGMDR